MKFNFAQIEMGEIAEIVMGQSPPGNSYNDFGDGLPFYQGVKDFGIRYPQKRVYCNSPRKIAQPGDILFSVRAPIGRVNIATEKCSIGRGIAIIRSKDPLDQTFLEFSLLNKFDEWYTLESQGSVFGNAKKSDLEKLSILWPDREIRQFIANILDSLSNKINVNQQMNKTLEEIGQTIFKHWFVDFEFPNENGEPYKSSGGEMVDSPLGPIPKGWKIGKLSDIARINQKSIKKSNMPKKINYIDISSVSEGKIEKIEKINYTEAPSRAKRIVEHGDIIWSCVRPNRRSFSIILDPINNLIVSTGFAVITPKTVPFTYLYYFVSTKEFTEYLSNNAKGSAYPAVTKKDFEISNVLIPSCILLEKFHILIKSLMSEKNKNFLENQKITELRDTFLSKLISGEIRV